MPLFESDLKAMILLGSLGLASCFLSYRTGLRQRSQHTPRAIATTPGSSFFLSGVMGGSGGGASNLAGVAVERLRDDLGHRVYVALLVDGVGADFSTFQFFI